MAKMIAIWGTPNSGKSTFTAKLAKALYEIYDAKVISLFSDMETPVLPVLLPNRKAEYMYSVGTSLSKTEITAEDVVADLVTFKDKPRFAFLGFKDGENRFSFPEFGEAKARELFPVLDKLADYVMVDCTCSLENPLSSAAVKDADTVLRIVSPDLKAITFNTSQINLYADPEYRLDRQIVGINTPNEDLFMPVEDVKAHFKGAAFTVPYCREVKQQMLDGKLLDKVSDKKFNAKLAAIVEKIV